MPVDNAIYEAPGDIWWDETQPLSSLRTAINPGRVGYLREVIRRLGLVPHGLAALDVGCGGGLMAEEVARLGFEVTGVDPAAPAVEVAARHASASGLAIEYRTGSGEALPFADSSFDLVYCCDVLEHVRSVPAVIAEAARVLKPGGVYFFDTINRTLPANLVMIKLFQEWRPTRWMPRDLHDWRQFIKPAELQAVLEQNGLRVGELTGLKPSANPPQLIGLLRQVRKGRLTPGEMGRRAAFVQTSDRSVLYAGYAVKRVAV